MDVSDTDTNPRAHFDETLEQIFLTQSGARRRIEAAFSGHQTAWEFPNQKGFGCSRCAGAPIPIEPAVTIGAITLTTTAEKPASLGNSGFRTQPVRRHPVGMMPVGHFRSASKVIGQYETPDLMQSKQGGLFGKGSSRNRH